ncbi:MAG: POT family MFS transporter [Phycisphaerales bacterium]
MAHAPYLTAPVPSSSMPKGIPYIVGNEAAERFSFYGMKTILAVFMTQYLLSSTGAPAYMTETEAREWVAWFVASAYFFPIFGAIVADAILGKYLTILILSIVYCVGHLCLALIDLPPAALQATFEPKTWLMTGLLLVALGSGGVKPCVSAHVGDQFGNSNKHLLARVFGWFYFAINFGSFFSTLLTPWLLKNPKFGPAWAFGVPGVLMLIATIIFWMGRHKFVHIPPRGWRFVTETFSGDGLVVIAKLVPIYAFVAIFWSLYDQTGGAWVLQASQLDCQFLGTRWLESQVQAVNPLLILIYIPIFSYIVYPFVGRFVTLTPVRKIGAGLFLTIAAFAISAQLQARIDTTEQAFSGTVAPLVESGKVDYKATVAALRQEERNASAAALEKLAAEPRPQDKAWAAEVTASLSKGGILVDTSGAPWQAPWPSIAWQILAYVVLTAAEVLVSITCLEFSYTQAPPQMKSFVMSLYLLSVSAGNVLTALVNRFTADDKGNSTLVGAQYYWFFTGLMAVAAVVYIGVGWLYKPRDYMQEESPGMPSTPGQEP